MKLKPRHCLGFLSFLVGNMVGGIDFVWLLFYININRYDLSDDKPFTEVKILPKVKSSLIKKGGAGFFGDIEARPKQKVGR